MPPMTPTSSRNAIRNAYAKPLSKESQVLSVFRLLRGSRGLAALAAFLADEAASLVLESIARLISLAAFSSALFY